MRVIGLSVLAIGALIVLFGLTKSGAALYSETLNMGLLNDKTNLTLAGGFTSVVGAIFAAVGLISSRIERGAVRQDVRGDL